MSEELTSKSKTVQKQSEEIHELRMKIIGL
jgi:hypothetical protein